MGRACEVGRKDLALVMLTQMEHKVSQGYSPAGENAGSLTPFEMTSYTHSLLLYLAFNHNNARISASVTALAQIMGDARSTRP